MLCLAELMIMFDTTIVNVALPSIRSDLGDHASSTRRCPRSAERGRCCRLGRVAALNVNQPRATATT